MTTSSACCDSCASAPTASAIACTLGSDDFAARLAGIRHLAQRALRYSRRDGLALTLIYDRGALDEVRALVAKESECCSFLNFDLLASADAVQLTITAPIEAAGTAGELFAHFAAAPARQAA